MPLPLPPLHALCSFEVAARHLSFKLAAEELRLTPSAVSHAVISLERRLGVKLFDRKHRGLALTAAGVEYLSTVGAALSIIAVGTQRLRGRLGARAIRVSSAPTIAARWLLPSLRRWQQQCGLAVEIDTSYRQVRFPDDGFDVAIRMGGGSWPGTVCTPLLKERLVPVCSPHYLRQTASTEGSVDLSRATLIHVTSITEDWSTWLAATSARSAEFSSNGLLFDTIHLAIEAAEAGLGVAMGRRPLIDRQLADGTLIVAARATIRCAGGYWLVGCEGAEDRPEVKAFKRWLLEEAKMFASPPVAA